MKRASAVASFLLAWLAAAGQDASAYEFEVRALTIGQGYQLHVFRPLSGDFAVNRRRFTQTLALEIWDIGEPPSTYSLYDTRNDDDGPEVYVSTYLRIDHDFGEYVSGTIRLMNDDVFDAVDLIPEIDDQSLNFEMLWGYVGVRDIGGFVDVELGRKLVVDQLEWWSFDGATVRAHTPWRLAVEAFGGARVRDSSPLGSPVQEPDGTPGAECVEYVEGGDTPGSGNWRPIDRPVLGGSNPFEAEFDICPQRDEWMPTFGGAIRTEDDAPVQGAVTYRRSVSKSPGLIGPVDRLEGSTDVGYYPNEIGQAPGWGVNEERVAATLRGTFGFARGRARVTPFAGTRYSLLHGLFDEHLAGVRLKYGAHTVSPEYYYSFPTFDGDSIFNVFSVSAYHDARLTYELQPAGSAWTSYARGWARLFRNEDETDEVDGRALAGGGQLGARYRAGPRSSLRGDVFYEDGYGGLRTGAYAAARWALARDLELASRLSAIYFDEDLLSNLDGLTLGAQLGATYLINQGIALHVVVEENTNDFHTSQLRGIAMLDLAFHPEL